VVYAVWDRGEHIDFAASRDGGRTFSPSRSIIARGPTYMGAVTDLSPYFGALGCPQIAVDPQNRALYVTWSDFRNGDIDVFISRSLDHGASWSAPKRVNSNPVHDGTDQFFQAMAVDLATGAVYVQFYDRRDDPVGGRRTSITLARSTDQGQTFTNYGWSDPFVLHGIRVGDYMWLAAYSNRVYGAWAEAAPVQDSAATAQGRPERTIYRPVVRVGSADFSTQP
jgi:hypothetical protein